jgi:hypothetical protein
MKRFEEEIFSVDINLSQRELKSLKDILVLAKTFLFRIDRDFKYKHINEEKPLTPEQQKKFSEDYERLRKDHIELVIMIDSLMAKFTKSLLI